MEKYVFHHVIDSTEPVPINEGITTSLEESIELTTTHFLEVDAEGQAEILALRPRTIERARGVSCTTRADAIRVKNSA